LYTLNELTEAAGVSVRTVRYYIAEGLLPPPIGAGPGSAYTQGHLDRLQVIGRMKASYLPLREIRRHLAGLSDQEVRALAAETVEDQADAALAFSIREPELDSAASYLARVTGSPPSMPPPLAAPRGMRGTTPGAHPAARGTQHAALDTWRRVPLSDDAELLIREDAYQRKHERVEWLVRWARKVFG
jgi:DNA-binding transcriptional MerR regulator